LPDVDGQLSRVRSGNEVDGGHHVKEVPFVDPLAPFNDFLPHQRDVRGWPTKRREA
jgi:hypothetical protein